MQKETCDTLYYDGECPLCSFEINHLRKLADDNLSFVDVHDIDDPVEKEKRLKRLHLVDESGSAITGLDATVAAWSHTGVGFLFRPLRWRLVRVVADPVYNWWARKRYDSLYGAETKDTAVRRS